MNFKTETLLGVVIVSCAILFASANLTPTRTSNHVRRQRLETPITGPGYDDGWCGIHVTQHQKPDPATDTYSFDVIIKDASQQIIGQTMAMNLSTDQTNSVYSQLEWTVDIKAGAVDADPVWMYYGDQAWSSNDQEHHCDFGAYYGGKREGDCGFTC